MMRLAYKNPVAFVFVIFGKLIIGIVDMIIKVWVELIIALINIFQKMMGSAVSTMKGMANGFRRRKSEKLREEV